MILADNDKRFYIFNTLLVSFAILLSYLNWTAFKIPFDFIDIIIFLFFTVVSEFFSIELPKYGNVSVAFAIDLAAILLFGPFIAGVIAGLSYLIKDIINKDLKFYRLIFNISQIIITINVAGMFFSKIGGNFLALKIDNIIPVFFTAFIYSQLNVTLFALGFAILKRVSFREIWLTNIKSVLPNFLALIPVGVMIAYLYKNLGFLAVAFFFVPLIISRHTFKLYMDMRSMYLNTISSLATTIDAKDKYTSGHSERVSQYTAAIAKQLNLPEDEIENLKNIALLHDIGKIAVPESILNKPSKLSDEEFAIMKYHSEFGAEIVKKIKFLEAYEIIRAHHERIDGEGYPDKLTSNQIPLGAKIIAVADSFDAMTSDRPYRKALPIEVAFEELDRHCGKQFDTAVVAAFKIAYPNIKIVSSNNESLLTQEMYKKLKSFSGGDSVAL